MKQAILQAVSELYDRIDDQHRTYPRRAEVASIAQQSYDLGELEGGSLWRQMGGAQGVSRLRSTGNITKADVGRVALCDLEDGTCTRREHLPRPIGKILAVEGETVDVLVGIDPLEALRSEHATLRAQVKTLQSRNDEQYKTIQRETAARKGLESKLHGWTLPVAVDVETQPTIQGATLPPLRFGAWPTRNPFMSFDFGAAERRALNEAKRAPEPAPVRMQGAPGTYVNLHCANAEIGRLRDALDARDKPSQDSADYLRGVKHGRNQLGSEIYLKRAAVDRLEDEIDDLIESPNDTDA